MCHPTHDYYAALRMRHVVFQGHPKHSDLFRYDLGEPLGVIAKTKRKSLTAAFVSTIKEPGKYHDGKGTGLLFLLVKPTGGRFWVQRIVVRGKRRELGPGSPPVVSLAEAREQALSNKRTARLGGDPLAEKSRAKAAPHLRAGRAPNACRTLAHMEKPEGSVSISLVHGGIHLPAFRFCLVAGRNNRGREAGHSCGAGESAGCRQEVRLPCFVSLQVGNRGGGLRNQSINCSGSRPAPRRAEAPASESIAI